MLLIHGGYDGVRAADRLVPDGDGLPGLDIGEPVVVDYLKYLDLIQPVHGLRGLVVIHEHDALALRAQQMEARQRAHNAVVLVQNRIAAVAAFQHQLAHVVEIIGQMEADDVPGLADMLDRHRLKDEPSYAPRVERGGDDAGAAVIVGEVYVNIGLADYQAADARFERRLIAADDDAVRLRELWVAVGLRQGEHNVARDGLDIAAELVYELTLKHAQEVEHRKRLDV